MVEYFVYTVVLLSCLSASLQADDESSQIEFFEKKIRPVLVSKCYECHSAIAGDVQGGLLLDSRPAMLKGGDSGPVVVPGKPNQSLLYLALQHDSLEMPPKERLPVEVVQNFKEWILAGAYDPRDAPLDPQELASQIWEDTFRQRSQWWSFQPVAQVDPPTITRNNWSGLPMDRFILSALRKQGLSPSTRADKATLVRRLSFTLTGLPPSVVQVKEFVNDESPGAWTALVNLYLASPHFGEHFARHWMDVVRYTDTYGYEWDVPAKGAWRYRDYLTRAFNADVRYDQMVREQIAGDLLSEPRINHEMQLIESHIGPMFYQLGEHRHGDSSEFEGIHQEMLDNKIDAFSKAFQGLTIACARCHDHKLDPISQAEYYALCGAFLSSRWISRTIDTTQRNMHVKRQLGDVRRQLQMALTEVWLADLQKNIHISSLDDIQPATALAVGDINHPWNQIFQLDGDPLKRKWLSMLEMYQMQDDQAKAYNDANYTLVTDFDGMQADDWHLDGHGIEQIIGSGDFTLHQGDQFIKSLMLSGIATSRLSARLNGTLRSPLTRELPHDFLHVLVAGGSQSAQRTVIDNAFLCEKQAYYAHDRYQWKTLNLHKGQQDRKTYIEFATKTSNPNFPPRRGLGPKLTREMETSAVSWFSINKIYAAKGPGAPKKRFTAFIELLKVATPNNKEEAATLYRQWLMGMVKAWGAGVATSDQIQVLNNLLQTPWITKSASHPELASLIARCRAIESQILPPRTVNGLADLDVGEDYRLNIRGSYYDLGDPVPRGYLRLFADELSTSTSFNSENSGRLELANQVASEKNPLTARVYVNRVWQWLFGTGIVDTPSNFGKLGNMPSHPELLDWMTARFMENNWSTKQLVYDILHTATWQQADHATSMAMEFDPNNRLLHHYPNRRLEAESIGDAMLATAGTLDRKLYGAPHNPFRTAEDEMKRLFTGPVAGNQRRMLYTKVSIMEPSKFLSTFNLPDPKISTGRRDIANTPAQALTLLNHPFGIEIASQWADGLIQRDDIDPRSRLQSMLATAYSRKIQADELDRWESSLFRLSNLRQTKQNDIMTNKQLWADIAHVIFNTKEFIYIR